MRRNKTTGIEAARAGRYESLVALLPASVKKVFLTSSPREALGALDRFDGVHLGAEFCARRMPRASEIRVVLEECRRRGKLFSLVTPVMDDPGAARMKRILNALGEYAPFDVVINDYGTFDLAAGAGLVPVAGRVIIKQKSDPRLAAAPRGTVRGLLKQTSCDNTEFRALLAGLGVKRIEMDNVPGAGPLPEDFSVSLHFPYVFLTMKMTCGGADCRSCGGTFVLKSPRLPVELLLRGNAQFYVNGRLPETAGGAGRIVFSAEPPA